MSEGSTLMPFVRLSINARESRCNVRHAEGGGGGSYVKA